MEKLRKIEILESVVGSIWERILNNRECGEEKERILQAYDKARFRLYVLKHGKSHQ